MTSKRTILIFGALFAVLLSSVTVFAQADMARRTTAITYPLDETVRVNFRGTTRFPRMKGSARVKRTSRYGTRIELAVDKMPRPFELGAGYATYVVWAISPEGQIDNLGEIKRSGIFFIDSKITVTTTLQTFALIITAEPHFLVARPSQAIMLENLNPVASRNQRIGTIAAVQYFGNTSDYFRDPRTPEIAESDYAKTPSSILQARQAIALARYAGADRDAPTELEEAEALFTNSVNAWQAGRDSDSVDISARRAISAAVKAESVAFQRKAAREVRNERTRTDAEIRAAEEKFVQAQDNMESLRSELARETRNRELAERDAANYANQLREVRDENGRLREELGRTKVEAETFKARLDAAESDKQTLQQEQQRAAREAAIKAAEPALISSLKAYGMVTQTERGIELNLVESYWKGIRTADMTPLAERRLSELADILERNPNYRIAIESHTDNSGNAGEIQSVTDKRAFAIASKLAAMGVEEGRIMAKGLGASEPVAPNTTNANRARNRRSTVILTLNM